MRWQFKMSVIGTGIDLVECARIQRSIDRFGDRFLHRVFTDGEIKYSMSMKFPARHLAARFAVRPDPLHLHPDHDRGVHRRPRREEQHRGRARQLHAQHRQRRGNVDRHDADRTAVAIPPGPPGLAPGEEEQDLDPAPPVQQREEVSPRRAADARRHRRACRGALYRHATRSGTGSSSSAGSRRGPTSDRMSAAPRLQQR